MFHIHTTFCKPLARKSVNPRPAGVFSRTRAAEGGGRFCPLPYLRMGGRSEEGEVAIESYQMSHIFNIFEQLKNIKRSHVWSKSGQMSKSSLFALSAAETGLITADSPNFANRHHKG